MTRTRWTMFGLLLVLVSINYIDRGSLSVALPLIRREFDLGPEVSGVLLSVFFWFYAAAQVPAGWLIDRFGPRRLVTGSCVGWGLATMASGLATGPLGLAAARGAIGLAEAPIMPAGGKLNASWLTAHERGRGATILDSGAPLGSALGGILIAGLIGLTGGWRPAFIAAGIMTVVFGGLAWWYIRDHPREHPRTGVAELRHIEDARAEEDAVAPGRRAGLRHYVRFRSFWAMCLGWLGFNGVFYGLLTWGPQYLSDSKGFDISTIGWSTFVIFGAGFVGELLGGWLCDRLRARGVRANVVLRGLLGAASALVVAGLIGLVVVPAPLAAVVLLSVVLFFLRWVGLFWAVPATLGGREDAGVLGGAMNLAGNVSGLATPIVVGLLVGATGGYTAALLYFVGCGVLMLACVLVLDYSRRLSPSAADAVEVAG